MISLDFALEFLKMMLKDPKIEIEIASHTDSKGKAVFNMSLSQLRADNIPGMTLLESLIYELWFFEKNKTKPDQNQRHPNNATFALASASRREFSTTRDQPFAMSRTPPTGSIFATCRLLGWHRSYFFRPDGR